VGLGPLLKPSRADLVQVGVSHDRIAVLTVQPDSETESDFDEIKDDGGGEIQGKSGLMTADCTPVTRSVAARVAVTLELRSVADEPLSVSVEVSEAPLGAVRWEGKVSYSKVPLAPHASLSMKFCAVVSKAGVFDLKRFQVTVASPDGSNPANKSFVDNSLLTVVE